MSQTVGQNIRRLRRALDMTQSALAKKIGVNVRTINQWEKGKHKPTQSVVDRLAETLGVSTDELMGGVTNAARPV